ncbi:C-C motif chemokine 36.1 [Paramisgurnus dabryanus]|uniref:C-C motif chemokine 36.1 n=1 Tax=Paramisgurnus dabryanus TaxID=90735 RepID=UPI003CCF4965
MAQNDGGPAECCFKFFRGKISTDKIYSYLETRIDCPYAVVMTLDCGYLQYNISRNRIYSYALLLYFSSCWTSGSHLAPVWCEGPKLEPASSMLY